MFELAALFFLAVLIVLSVVDVRERRIPNRIVLPATAILLVVQTLVEPARAAELVVATLGAGALLLLLVLVNPSGLGMGDVKLAMLMGAALGGGVVAALALGSGLAAAFGVARMIRGGLTARHSTFPYAPFLAVGSALALLT
jgi:leader peptidase (prepilin peptidase)/N-methyltransferase